MRAPATIEITARAASEAARVAFLAAPIAYQIDGEQYIAVLVGWGGAYPMLEGKESNKSGNERNVSRILVFKLGANASLPPLSPETQLVLDPPPSIADAATGAAGQALFGRYGAGCHGEAAVSGGVAPDLRASGFLTDDTWYDILLNGALKEGGMASFGVLLDRAKPAEIRAYIIQRSNEGKAASGKN